MQQGRESRKRKSRKTGKTTSWVPGATPHLFVIAGPKCDYKQLPKIYPKV